MAAYKLVRDMLVFTELRLILVDKQGVTGKKAEYQTIPYTSIVRFAKESSGIMELDAECKIWVRSRELPFVTEFRKNKSINDVYRLLPHFRARRVVFRGAAGYDWSHGAIRAVGCALTAA